MGDRNDRVTNVDDKPRHDERATDRPADSDLPDRDGDESAQQQPRLRTEKGQPGLRDRDETRGSDR